MAADASQNPEESVPGRSQRDRKGRMYKSSELPVMSEEPIQPDDEAARTVLLSELNEVSGAWRMLTDVRFKLLALVPPISALALIPIVSPTGILEDAGRPVRVAAAVFGFLVTLGLRIYDRRNDDLYDDLISRGRRVEYELGVDTGVFRGRKAPRRLWKSRLSAVNHGVALKLVYGTVLAAWFLAGLSVAVGWVPVS